MKEKYKLCKECNIKYIPKSHDTNSKYCSKYCRDKAYIKNGKSLNHLTSSKLWKENNKERVRLYNVWKGMIKRCFDKTYKEFYLYGGRGITISKEWLCENGFDNFYNWAMNNGYKIEKQGKRNKFTLDRINNDGNYEPSNCRWADNIMQSRNKRVSSQSRTGVSGVSHYENRYRVTINVDYIQKHIGCFKNFDDAVKARKQAEKLYWGK